MVKEFFIGLVVFCLLYLLHTAVLLQSIQWTRRSHVLLVKKLLSDAREIGENLHFAMLLHMFFPLGNGLQSTMELLYARQARS